MTKEIMKSWLTASLYSMGVVAVLILVGFMFVWPTAEQVPKAPQLRVEPSDVAGKDVKEQLAAIQFQHAAMIQKMAALEQHLSDMDHRLDIHRNQIDSLDPGRSTERLVRLEDFVSEYNRIQAAEQAKTDARWSNVTAWVRATFICLLGFGLNEVWKRYSTKEQSAVVNTKITHLTELTNNRMDALLQVSKDSARAEGVIEGTRTEKDRVKDA